MSTGAVPITNRPRPACFAWYIAASAARKRSTGRSCAEVGVTSPMLAVTTTDSDPTATGIRTASSIRAASDSSSGSAGGALHHDDELVAAEPGHSVRLADDGLQVLGRSHEQLVAGLVAQGVVDPLDVVEVDEQDGDVAAVPARAGQRLLEPVQQQPAVGQAGEGVVQGECHQLVLGGPPGGDVLDHADREGGAVLFVPTGVDQHPDHGAVAADQPALGARSRLPPPDHAQPRVLGRLDLVGVHEPGERRADQLLPRVAEEGAQRVVHLDEEALVGEQGHADRERTEDLGEPGLVGVHAGLPEDSHDERPALDGDLLSLGGQLRPGHRAEDLPPGHPGCGHPPPVPVDGLPVAGVDGVELLRVRGRGRAYPEEVDHRSRPRHRVCLRVPRPEAAHTFSIGPMTERGNRPSVSVLSSADRVVRGGQGSQDHRPWKYVHITNATASIRKWATISGAVRPLSW